MTHLTVVLALLAAGDGVRPLRWELDGTAWEAPILQGRSGALTFGMQVGAQARASLPFGWVDDGNVFIGNNVIIVEDALRYGDLFDPGVGLTLEVDVLFRPPPPRPGGPPWEDVPAMGIYVAFEWDRFGGDSAEDENDTRIRPDTMEVESIFVGFKAQGTVNGPLFGDLRVGLGSAHYPSVDAKFRPAGAATESTGELFSEGWEIAMELRMHFGWRAGPLGLVFGFGGRLFGGPDAGDASDLDPGLLILLDFEVGIELGF